jgi:integrase/recombinase XerC
MQIDLPAAGDVKTAFANWTAHLADERRLSPLSVEAYARDVRFFLGFLQEHFGGPPSLKDLKNLQPRDIRAFLARRRSEGLTSRSVMRALAAARSFARFLERSGRGSASALSAIRAPKIARSLPKPGCSTASPPTRRWCSRPTGPIRRFSRKSAPSCPARSPPRWRRPISTAC